MHLFTFAISSALMAAAFPADPPSLVGTWAIVQDGVEHKLLLSKDGVCTLTSKPNNGRGVEEQGKYVVEGGKLTITLKDRTLNYTFALKGTRLTLKGGKFGDEGVVFRKDESVDFRKLVGNWECKGSGAVVKTIRFRADGVFSTQNLIGGGEFENKSTGRYSIEEDNSLSLKESGSDESIRVFKLKLGDNVLTLNGPGLPPDGCTFVRKKEVTEIEAEPAGNLPGSALWDLGALKTQFRIVKTTYDREKREVVWILETRSAIATRPRDVWFKFYDIDNVRLETVAIEYRPADVALAKGDKLRGVLHLPAEQHVADMKKVITSDKP